MCMLLNFLLRVDLLFGVPVEANERCCQYNPDSALTGLAERVVLVTENRNLTSALSDFYLHLRHLLQSGIPPELGTRTNGR